MKLKIIYENDDVLVADKPAGIVVFPEGETKVKTIIDILLKEYPGLKTVGKTPRYGIVHRLDKDTSGILLIAKNNKSLAFFQKQFQDREVEKKYLALVAGKVKSNQGIIETLIGRRPNDRKKQKAFLDVEPGSEGKKRAITEYRVKKRFKDYTFVEVNLKTGRRHQIRCHFSYLGYPIAGDKLYGFKNQPCPRGLNRQFLHASYLKIKLPNGENKDFNSELPDNLKKILNGLE